MPSTMKTTVLFAAALVSLLLCAKVEASSFPKPSATGKGKILPLQPNIQGKSVPQWIAEWWKWVYSIPADNHPLTKDGETDCTAYQPNSNVWFLGGSYLLGPSDIPNSISLYARRKCTIPSNKFLFMPALNVECDTLFPEDGHTEAELKACSQSVTNLTQDIHFNLDGYDFPNALATRKSVSPLFTFGPLPQSNLIDSAFAGQTANCVSDGWYFMLAPLALGHHQLSFGGKVVFPADPQDPSSTDFTVVIDIAYQLSVTNPSRRYR